MKRNDTGRYWFDTGLDTGLDNCYQLSKHLHRTQPATVGSYHVP